MINEMNRIYKVSMAEGSRWKFNELEVSIFYERGDGYVFRIIPRRRDAHGYEYVYGWGWTGGYRVMVVRCNRQSKKRYEEAVSYMNALEDEFIPKLEAASEGKIKVHRYEFTQEERDRYAK
jgi:hypothetical protein